MDPFHGACEIVELRDELVASQHSKETNRLSGGPIVGDRTEKFSRQKTAGRYTLEDEINKLFEAIELRASARGLGPSCQFSKGSSQISASKKPIRGGISQASGIGISESVTLKQALRGLRISHASEVAAMKRVSKSTASSKVAEAVAVKRLYRAVVVEANDSGLTLDESKGSLLQISLVPEESKLNSSEKISSQATREENLSSTAHSSPQFAVPATTEISMIKAQPEGVGPVPTEVGTQALTLKLGQEGKLKSALSLCCSNISNRTETLSKDTTASKDIESKRAMMKFGKNLKLNFSSSLLNSSASSKVKKSVSNSPRVVSPVPKNNCFPNKKMKKEVSSACSSSNTCIADVDSALSPSASKVVCQAQNSNQNVLKEPACSAFSSTCLDVNVSLSNADYKANKSVQGLDSCNKRNFDAKASECSRSREAADFSQSSKSSLGAYSSTTCISDESNVCGSSCSGSRPHMSKDLRWEAIRRVEMQHGSLDLRHFKLLKRLGCGDLGTVYLAELTGTNCLFAVKIMDNESLGSRKKMPRALTERDILQVLDHPFLPTLFAYFTTNKFSILVMEYCPGGDLHILRQKQPGSIFTEQAARFYVAEVLLALEYLHMLGIVYRDLKPENILVREDGHIMLSDFDLSLRCTVKPTLVKASLSLPTPTKGISGPCVGCICTDPFCVQPSWVQVPCFTPRHVSTPTNIRKLKSNSMTQVPQLLAEPTNARSHSFVGTHEYLAPEIIRGEGHGNAVDWWTFGIFLYELLFGTTPFKGPGNDDTLVNVVMHSVKFPESSSVSSQAKDLIRGLLKKEPKDRFGSAKGAAEIRKHPFFKGLNWALIRCAVPPTVPKSSETGVSLTTTEENKLVEYKMSSAEHPEFDTF